MNTYQLAGTLCTTGWNTSNDVNATNEYGMTPAEVALQAGNVSEFAVITSHPDFQPTSMGRVGLFLQICQRESESHYKALRQYIDENFTFDQARKAFCKLA